MERGLVGAVLMLSAIILDAAIIISGAILGTVLTGWSTTSGRLWTAVGENHLVILLVIAQLVLLAGIIILGKAYFDKSIN